MTISRSLTALFVLALAASTLAANCPADPYADPKHDQCNPLKYIPNNSLTGVAVFMVAQVFIGQIYCIWKWGAKWMMAMTIGAFFFALGLATRIALHSNPQSRNVYIAENTLVVLSPCLFIAADYVLLGRLAAYLQGDKYLLISPRRITIVFVSSDIFTFLIQGSGGGLLASASGDASRQKLGANVFLVGLIAQLVSFVIFTIMYLVFLYRLRKNSPEVWNKDSGKPWFKSWHALAFAMVVSCIGVTIRCGFRVVELAQGFDGFLATNEPLFYILDTAPLWIATAIYIPFWPGRIMTAPEYAYSAPSIEMARQRGQPYYKAPGSMDA